MVVFRMVCRLVRLWWVFLFAHLLEKAIPKSDHGDQRVCAAMINIYEWLRQEFVDLSAEVRKYSGS